MGSAAAAMVTILASSGIARIANIGFRTGWISKEASRISDNVQKRQLDESSPVQKISELDWIPNWLKTRPIILGLSMVVWYLSLETHIIFTDHLTTNDRMGRHHASSSYHSIILVPEAWSNLL